MQTTNHKSNFENTKSITNLLIKIKQINFNHYSKNNYQKVNCLLHVYFLSLAFYLLMQKLLDLFLKRLSWTVRLPSRLQKNILNCLMLDKIELHITKSFV